MISRTLGTMYYEWNDEVKKCKEELELSNNEDIY